MRRHHGFSFAEVMFSVAILGIGFVMVAAIFPIAAEQTRSTADQSVAANLARNAIDVIQNCTHAQDYPHKDSVTHAFADPPATLWDEVSGSTINPADTRYAWVPFYSQPTDDGTVRVTVLVVRRWIHDRYTAADIKGDLVPRGIGIESIVPQPDGTELVTITRDDLGMYKSVAPGCFLFLRSAEASGKTFRVGQYQGASATSVFYSLVPGEGIAAGETYEKCDAALIGRDFKNLPEVKDSSDFQPEYDGPAQDVAVYTTFIRPG